MYEELKINLGNLLLSFSDAIDLASPQIAAHQIRTAFITWEIGREMELNTRQIERLFEASLLHDIGAISVRERERIQIEEEINPTPHCQKGAAFLSRVSFLKHVAPIVLEHHRPWEEWLALPDSEDALLAQILHLADMTERAIDREAFILHQNSRILKWSKSEQKHAARPDIFEAFRYVARKEDFWLDLVSPRLYSLLLHRGPYRKVEIGIYELLEISEMFRNLVDFRSRFTATHSSGVAASASRIAQAFGMTPTEVQMMQIAGNLHDLGKLAIPNEILEKPGKLTENEYQVMKMHTYCTYSVLNTIGGLRQIPEWAAFHHEKLDGTGYPFHLGASQLDTGARIIAVADVFTAISEDRPYRKGMKDEKIAEILTEKVQDGSLDTHIVELLLDNMGAIRPVIQEQQRVMREYYEKQFSSLSVSNSGSSVTPVPE
jgi:HD-GYP domain-containing protein (c-di-GMP phosphodiesterase class II)